MFVIFSITKEVFDKTNRIVYSTFLYSIKQEDYHFNTKIISYQIFSDFFHYLGNIIPVAVLLFIPKKMLNTNTLIIALALVSLMPLATSFVYKTKFKWFSMVED